MKKQIKQRQDDTQAKQNPNGNSNASANENRTPVSDETKQKLVKQYRDRAEASPSRSWDENIGGTFSNDDRFKNGPEYGWPENKNIDVQYRPHGEALNLRDEALNTPFWNSASEGAGYQSSSYDPAETINMDQLSNIVNAMSNDAMANREATNLSPNMLYGYGDAPRDFFSRYDTPAEKPEGYSSVYQFLEDEGLDDWVTNSGIADSGVDQLNAARAFQLMQNANDYYRQQELDQWAQQYRDQQLYGDALMELIAQRTPQTSNRTLLGDALQQIREQEILDNRPKPRKRNITGSAVW